MPENVFDLLHPRLRKVIAELGYGEPTETQRLAIPRVLEGRNVLIVAPTGSGKTEAAVLPVLSRLLTELEERGESEGVRVIYISPMRALNRDIYHRLTSIVERCGLSIGVRHGDTSERERRRQAERPPLFLITTPETMQFLLVAPRMRRWLRNVRYVIVDELHELINDKRGVQLAVTLERLVEVAGEFQRVGLSATIGNVKLASEFLSGSRPCEVVYVPGVKGMRLVVDRPLPREDDYSKAQELGVVPDVYARLRRLDEYVRRYRTVLIFVNTRDTAELLGSRLSRIVSYEVGVYHGSLSREERERLERKLRSGEIRAVVTTSSLELGIDIGHVDAVIQYMSPRQVTRLVQRVGRSRHRVSEESIGYIVTSDLDDLLESIVIARFAVENKLEQEVEYHENALDVLAHQIVGILHDYRVDGRSIRVEDVYKIVCRAHPYRNLTYEAFMQVLSFLAEHDYVVLAENGEVRPGRGSYMYYVENASMIPDEAKYRAVDVSARRGIGELDEKFVSMVEPGTKIVLGGRVWTIVSIDHKQRVVYIEPAREVIGAVPAWIGEEIPVVYEVAQEVVNLRARLINAGPSRVREILEKYLDKLPVEITDDLTEFVMREVEKIHKSGVTVPEPEKIVIELCGKMMVVHVGLGSKGNEALGLYLSRYFSEKFSISVAYRSDPYRVILTFSRPVNSKIVMSVFQDMDPVSVEKTVMEAARNSKLYRYRFLHVARRFGVISREHSAEINVNRLIEALRDSPVDIETLNEILIDDLDLSSLKLLAQRVREGKIRVELTERDELSPLALSEEALYSKFDFAVSALPRHLVIELVKRRLEERELTLLCLRCGWSDRVKLRDIPDDFSCPVCGLRIVTVLKHRDEDIDKVRKLLEKIRKREPLTRDEKKLWEELRKRADIVLRYGKRGLYALAAHGVGSTTALRKIFSKITSSDEEFFQAILEAEKEYIKTRQFWE